MWDSTGRGGGRVKVTLFITALLEKYFSWSSSFHSCQSISALSVYLCFFISPLPSLPLTLCSSVSISLYLPLFLSFCWRCPVRDFNEMPVFEVEWWRWRDAIKNLIFTAERTCVSVCFPPLHLWASHLLAPGAEGRNIMKVRWTQQLTFTAKCLYVSIQYVWALCGRNIKSCSKELRLWVYLTFPLSINGYIAEQDGELFVLLIYTQHI